MSLPNDDSHQEWTAADIALVFGEEVALKWDPNQLRYPKGHPLGGKFAPQSGGVDARGDIITFQDALGKTQYVSPANSMYRHLRKQKDGTYKLSKERQALHDKIVSDAMRGTTPVDDPVMNMTGGGPASGKSTMLESDLIKDFPKNSVLINADDIKEQLPEYHQTITRNARQAAAFVHEESSVIGDRIRAAARENKRNVVYDTTGNGRIEDLTSKVERFRASGYKVNAYYASLRTDLAVDIADKRGQSTGRYVPEHLIRATHAKVSVTLDAAFRKNLFDRVSLYDTNIHNKPRLVATGDRNTFEIHDRPLYDQFLAKGGVSYKSADGTDLTVGDLESLAVEAVLGIDAADSPYQSSEAADARATIAGDIAKLPADAEVIIGKEYPGGDFSNLYDGPWKGEPGEEVVNPGTTVAKHDGEGVANNQYVQIKRRDDEKQIVYGEVYAPDVLDTYGEYMTAEDIEIMAHRFMQLDLRTAIDTQHDNVPNGAYPVESFVAREGDPDYTPGAWVLGVKIPDGHLWRQVKSGELNGFSFQSLVKPTSVEVEYSVIRDHVGKTESQSDHDHVYLVELDDIGNVIGGRTSKAADGHFHVITRASRTEESEGHNHRFFL